jgi:putative membrane protein
MKTSTLQSFRFAVLGAAAFLALSASAQTSITHADQRFIEKAAKSGMAEVDISRVVVDRTMNPQVRTFAQMMVDDHSKANEALASIAVGKGVQLPAKDTAVTDQWTKKSGKDLDADYVAQMVSDHQDAVKLFTKEGVKGSDVETMAFAHDTLPKLQHHLDMAVDLQKTLK